MGGVNGVRSTETSGLKLGGFVETGLLKFTEIKHLSTQNPDFFTEAVESAAGHPWFWSGASWALAGVKLRSVSCNRTSLHGPNRFDPN